VPGHIIDGNRWIAERVAFLRERLATALPGDERRACETELEVLSKERGIGAAGVRGGRVRRRLLRRT